MRARVLPAALSTMHLQHVADRQDHVVVKVHFRCSFGCVIKSQSIGQRRAHAVGHRDFNCVVVDAPSFQTDHQLMSRASRAVQFCRRDLRRLSWDQRAKQFSHRCFVEFIEAQGVEPRRARCD